MHRIYKKTIVTCFAFALTQFLNAQIAIITAGSSWKYYDKGITPATNWTSSSFNDAAWSTGSGKFGYGNGDEITTLSYGASSSSKFTTSYFRKSFTVYNTALFKSFSLNIKRDDGIVIYINGTEKWRNNMPAGTIVYSTYASASASDDGKTWQSVSFPANAFVTGPNTIAVEVHQSSKSSSDVVFDLELNGINATGVPVVKRGPYLQIGTPTSIYIKWITNIASDSKVSYGTSPSVLTSSVSNSASVINHELQLTGLIANTRYYYSIGSTSLKLQGDTANYFITAPVVGTTKKTRIWVSGDCGNNSTNQKNVRDQYLKYLGTNYTDAWLLLGDNAYAGGLDSEYQAKFFDVYSSKLLKQTVLWPAPGNHDYENNANRVIDHKIPYYDIFTLPQSAQAGGVASNTESYYSYNYANIHFISLDSYGKQNGTYKFYDTLGPQIVWLKKDLAANTQKWTIIYWHHPPYTLTSHNSETESHLQNIRQNLLQIMERYKVDLILCGHSHGYERTKLLKGHYGNEASFTSLFNVSQSSGKYDSTASSCPYIKNNSNSYKGTVYVVSGSAGQLSSTTQASYPHAAMQYSNVTNGGSVILEIESNRLDAKWLCADGVIRDKFTIEKDVNVKKNLSVIKGNSTTLTASWIGKYKWSTTSAATRSITVTPSVSTTYIVNDGMSCVADTFNVTVTAARPLALDNETDTISKGELSVKIYPNPTSGNATIEYTSAIDGAVNLDIFDMAGKKIKALVNEQKRAGTYTYTMSNKSINIKPGVYLVKLSALNQKVIQRLIIRQE